MSTHIVDRVEAIRFPKERTGHYEDVYLVAELGGDNNVRDAHGRRARSWSAMAIGMEWEVIGQACRFASDCSGGMTKLRGRATNPEAYIRAYRKALANAADDMNGARERGLSVHGRIRFTEAEQDSWHYKELVEKKPAVVEYPFGEKRTVFHFDLNNPEDLKLWLSHCHRAGWHNAEVGGPGEI